MDMINSLCRLVITMFAMAVSMAASLPIAFIVVIATILVNSIALRLILMGVLSLWNQRWLEGRQAIYRPGGWRVLCWRQSDQDGKLHRYLALVLDRVMIRL